MEAQTPPPRTSHGNGHRLDEPWPADDPHNPAQRAFHDVPIWIAELKSYLQYFISAKVDGAKASLKRAAIYGVLGIVGLLTAAGVLFTATFLLLSGLAMGLGRLLGSRFWLGNLIVGAVVLAGIWLGVWLAMKKVTNSSRTKTEKKYESKRNQQRTQFGHDIEQRAGK